ncbi:SH2 domain containing protein [Aphelenchoides besseyi]|nr:SH2 domain containing protein [Aphelenchoides besseyi]
MALTDPGSDLAFLSELTDIDVELQSQRWYWGAVSKEALSIAMQQKPTGTFAVRDGSTPGNYTLTVRVDDANKLVKIIAADGHVGFTPETLDFESVVDLVEYFKQTSLEEHNPALKTPLKFPLLRDSNSIVESSQEKSLIPDRVPRKLAKSKKRDAKIDNEHRATAFVLHHFLEGLIAEMQRTERRHNLILAQIESLEQEHEHHKKAIKGYDNIQHLLNSNRGTLKQNLGSASDEKIKDTVSSNITLQDKRIGRVHDMRRRLELSLEGIARIKEGLHREDLVMTKRVRVIKERCDRYTNELLVYGVDRAFIERTTDYVHMAMQKESDNLLQNMLKVNLVTSPFDWLTMNPDKTYTTGLVRQSLKLLKKRNVANTNGVFLMRPSSSRPGCFALSISMNDTIYNCLVEYREPDNPAKNCGYAFLNTNLFYTTLCDFVRYYSLVTLREHNEQLDTVLRIPVLRYLATVRRRRKEEHEMDEIDREEAELMSELELDDADRCNFGDSTDEELEEAFSSDCNT